MPTTMFAPDGSVRSIPDDQVDAALQAGGKRALQMKDPQGTLRYVPEDQVTAAQQAGGTLVGADKSLWQRFKDFATTDQTPSANDGIVSRVVGNFAQGIGAPPRLADYVNGPAEMLQHPVDSAKLLLQSVSDAQQQTFDKAKAAYNKPGVMNKLDALGYGVESMIPVVGPALANAGEQVASGDVAGGLSKTAGLATGLLAASPEARAAAADTVKPVVNAAANAANKVNPRGILADKMAEVPPGELFSRAEVNKAARDHGITLDLADATDSSAAQQVKKSTSVSSASKGLVVGPAYQKNVANVLQWGQKMLADTGGDAMPRNEVGSMVRDRLAQRQGELEQTVASDAKGLMDQTSPVDLNREQTGDAVKKSLLDQQSNLYDQAGQYFEQVDKTVGSSKPDVTDVRKIAKEIVDDNKDYYAKHPELRPGQAWKTVQTLASDGSTTPDGLTWKEFVQAKMPATMKAVATKAEAMDLLKKQFKDLGGDPDAKPITYTWSDLQKLRSDMMKAAESTDIVGSRSEGWLKHLEGAISEAMDKSAGKLSPMEQELYQKANGIWQTMKGTYDNPQHPFYHIVRALDGRTAGDMAANLKPEFVRQLQSAMGDDFGAYQRDAIGRLFDPSGSGTPDFSGLAKRLDRAGTERLQAVLSPDQLQQLRGVLSSDSAQQLSNTFNNPRHPFSQIVKTVDGSKAANLASRLSPEVVNQLHEILGDDFKQYTRDQLARLLSPHEGQAIELKTLGQRVDRSEAPRLEAALGPERTRELQLLGDVARKVGVDINPPGSGKVVVPLGELGVVAAHPVAGLSWVGGNYAAAKLMNSRRVVDFLTKPAKDFANLPAKSVFGPKK